MANELRLFQNYLGGRLTYAMPAAATVVTDGVSNSSTTITSATAAFTPADVGATVTGTDLPALVYIASYTNPTTVVLSAAATGTGSARTWTINRHLTMHSAALAAMNVVGTTAHMMAGLDPDGMAGAPEIVMITKHDSAATWAQILRAQEGTTARAHTNSGGDADWVGSPAFATDIGTWVRRVRQTLTDKTSWAGITAEQWGTEEATLDDLLLPRPYVTAYAHVVGSIENHTDFTSLITQVSISLDGGSTWDDGTSLRFRKNAAGGTNDRQPIMTAHQVTGTATGDIQARVMATSAVGAADTRDLMSGVIFMEVLV